MAYTDEELGFTECGNCGSKQCDGLKNCPKCGEDMSCDATQCSFCYNPADDD